MARRYQTGDRVYVQAQRIWLILSSHAVLRREIRCNGFPNGLVGYGDLAELMGKDRRAGITLTRQLGIVGHYCLEHELPPLNVIVVKSKHQRAWGRCRPDPRQQHQTGSAEGAKISLVRIASAIDQVVERRFLWG